MGTKDPRVDAYIRKSAEFARPILTRIRAMVHTTCPDVEETLRCGMPTFMHHGIMCGMAAFKQHATFGFWKSSLILDKTGSRADEAMGQFGRLYTVKDLPAKGVLHQEGDAVERIGHQGGSAGDETQTETQGAAGPAGCAGQEPEGAQDLAGIQPEHAAGVRRVDHRGENRSDPPETHRHLSRMDRRGKVAQLEIPGLLTVR